MIGPLVYCGVVASLIWLVAAILLIAAEAASGDFFLLMLGGGALAAAGVSLVGTPVWVDGVVFALVSVLLIFVVRPALLRKFAQTPMLTTNADALSGKQALVLEEVGEHAGQVKLSGEVWTARPLDASQVYPPGTSVTVVKIDGATAIVWKEP